MNKPVCKICRRLGTKLFLKGEKCNSPKCPIVKKSYPPGEKGKRGSRRRLSEYGRELREKQKLKNFYNLSEEKFRNYVEAVLEKRGTADSSQLLIDKLERRLDNVVFRLGIASSRAEARQLISHGHFMVNDEKVDIPSYKVDNGDTISIRPSSRSKKVFDNLSRKLKNYETPSWLVIDKQKLEGKVTGTPSIEDISIPVKVSSIFEFYSR